MNLINSQKLVRLCHVPADKKGEDIHEAPTQSLGGEALGNRSGLKKYNQINKNKFKKI